MISDNLGRGPGLRMVVAVVLAVALVADAVKPIMDDGEGVDYAMIHGEVVT